MTIDVAYAPTHKLLSDCLTHQPKHWGAIFYILLQLSGNMIDENMMILIRRRGARRGEARRGGGSRPQL